MTLAIVLLMTIVSGTLVAAAMNEYQTAGVAEVSRQSLQIAEAGVARAVFELARDADWGDGAQATQEHVPGDTTTWYRLYDRAAYVENTPFPAPSPLGTMTVRLRAVSTAEVPGCNSETCIWIQAIGRVRTASRRVEVLLGKLTAANFTAYSVSSINIGAGGGGNGVFTLHGAMYIANCTNMVIDGVTRCVSLNLQGDGAILNDRPGLTDTPGVQPYHNRVYARGMITGQGNSWTIGRPEQPMWGVHASQRWPEIFTNQIHALHPDDAVPYIPFADPSTLVAAHWSDGINAMTAYVCTRPTGSCSAAEWQPVDLADPTRTLTLESNVKVVIPDQASGIDCQNPAKADRCNNAAQSHVTGTDDFSLVFNGFLTSGQANLSTQRNAYIHMQSKLLIRTNVSYEGFTTFLLENTAADALEIRSSLTPVCLVSQGAGCPQTFGQPNGHTYAFAVGPRNAATPGGGVFVRGAGLELDTVFLAHGTIHNRNPQNWYGLFVANALDFDQNPQIDLVPSLRANLPPGVGEQLLSGSFGVQIYRWREVF
jgi:hypothetical protein